MKTILNEIDNRLSLQPPLVATLPFINKTSPEYPFYDNLYGFRHSCYERPLDFNLRRGRQRVRDFLSESSALSSSRA